MTLHRVFGYGSNLRTEQLWHRCPGARVVAAAVLPGHRLGFGGHSARWGGAVATVVRSPGDQVPGILFELDDEDLARLDGFEGVPRVYARIARNVSLQNGSLRRAQVYELLGPLGGSPSLEYERAIRDGLREHGLDTEGLRAAVRNARASGPRPAPAPRYARVVADRPQCSYDCRACDVPAQECPNHASRNKRR